jgi:hypothetical protein
MIKMLLLNWENGSRFFKSVLKQVGGIFYNNKTKHSLKVLVIIIFYWNSVYSKRI